MMVLSHAHALFSHVEDLIREGELLPGPDKHRHMPSLPACEFPTGHPEARVLVRKHRARQAWLIVAWAADGVEREVTVDVPILGKVVVQARPCGSVYRVTASDKIPYEPPVPDLKLIDTDGMLPTQNL
jgi:hypothetical protein